MLGDWDTSGINWYVVAAAGTLYVLVALRLALHLRRMGQNPVFWFVVTVFFTPLPAIFFLVQRMGRSYVDGRPPIVRQFDHSPKKVSDPPADTGIAIRDGLVRCPHCGLWTPRDQLDRTGGVVVCPGCKLLIGQNSDIA